MPYEKDGKRYTRVTEFCSYPECEALAYIDKTQPIHRARKANAVTLAGTLCHHKIADHELTLMPKPYKGNEFELGTQERAQFKQIILAHKEQKMIQREMTVEELERLSTDRLMTKYEKIMEKMNMSYANYQQFIFDHQHKPVYVEEKRFNNEFLIAGTVDLLAQFYLRGEVVTLDLHPDIPGVGQKQYFVENAEGSEHCWVTTILDWKTSSKKQAGHKLQMSTYHLLWELSGDLDHLRKMGHVINSDCWSVLLGERTRVSKKEQALGPVRPYQLFKYDVDTTHFLPCLKIRENPRPITADINGKVGLKGRCIFCSEVYNCPDNTAIPNSYYSRSIIPMTEWNLKDTSPLLLALNELDNSAINPVKDKIQEIHNKLLEMRAVFGDTEVDAMIAQDADIDSYVEK